MILITPWYLRNHGLCWWTDLVSLKDRVQFREVIQFGNSKELTVEINLLDLKLQHLYGQDKSIRMKFSREATLKDVQSEMKKVFNNSTTTETRLWSNKEYGWSKDEPLADLDCTWSDKNISFLSTISIEIRNQDGTWPRRKCLRSMGK